MFIAIALILLGFIGLLTFYDWIRYKRLNNKEIQRILIQVSKLIIIEDFITAKKLLTRLIENHAGGLERALLEIQVLRGLKEPLLALQCVHEAMLLFPHDLLLSIEEGKCYLEINETKKAIASFELASHLIRKESDLHDFATSYLKGGFPERAWEVLSPFLSSNLHLLAGDILSALKEYARAIDFYQKVTKKDLAWSLKLAAAYLGLGKVERAEEIYRKIYEKDPSESSGILGLGACMQKKGLYQRALLIYQSSSAWEKKDPAIIFQAALCALNTERYSYAENYFSELIEMLGAQNDLLTYHGYTLELQGKWEEAEQNYLRQSELFPEEIASFKSLAWLFGVGLSVSLAPEKGVELARKAVELSSDPISWELLSAAEARVGHFEIAHEIQEYLSKFDQGNEARVRRASVLKLLRKHLPLDTHHLSRTLVA